MGDNSEQSIAKECGCYISLPGQNGPEVSCKLMSEILSSKNFFQFKSSIALLP